MDTIGFGVVARRKRRFWTDDEKQKICAQTRVAGVSVSQVARRYDVNANLVFTWLRDPRFAPEESAEEPAHFLPVAIVEEAGRRHPAAGAEGRIEIALAGGHNVRVIGVYDPEVLARLIRGLTS